MVDATAEVDEVEDVGSGGGAAVVVGTVDGVVVGEEGAGCELTVDGSGWTSVQLQVWEFQLF